MDFDGDEVNMLSNQHTTDNKWLDEYDDLNNKEERIDRYFKVFDKDIDVIDKILEENPFAKVNGIRKKIT